MSCEECRELSYTGSYDGSRCRTNCGEMSQQYYKIPLSWLLFKTEKGNAQMNQLIIFDELGGDTAGVKLVQMLMELK